ncbi:hypothetical protein [Allokutzneria albata]|uniref:Uncharacterized protein n=1 Tax=Allokutzneria albata TaxID=211114 RepID=A0A1G9SAN4_ALLAB|nr:hypothetical protein [Allokutzneria albata]SDM32479.1 hypothetical protein SAMN04489726_1017 [Allokutzneria albata]
MRRNFIFAPVVAIAASLLVTPVSDAAASPCTSGSIAGFKEVLSGGGTRWHCKKKKGGETIDFLTVNGCWAARSHQIVLKFYDVATETCSNGEKRSFPKLTGSLGRASYS